MLSRVLGGAFGGGRDLGGGADARGMARLLPLRALPAVAIVWFFCAVSLGLFRVEPIGEFSNIVLALPIALLLHWASEILETIFDDWYGIGGEYTGSLPGGCLPAGRDLDMAREAAMETLGVSANDRGAGDEVYERALARLERHHPGMRGCALALEFVATACRGLVMTAGLTAVFSLYLVFFGGTFGTWLPLATIGSAVVLGIAFAMAAFLGFVYARWQSRLLAFHFVAQSDG